MDSSGNGKSPNTSLSFRYNANNEELEELFDVCEDDQLSPQLETIPSEAPSAHTEASPKKGDKAPSILDKYFKSIRTTDKLISEKEKEEKESKTSDESRTPPKEISSSPMKEYLNRFGKKNLSGSPEGKDTGGSETWKLFHDFKFKIARAVEDMKTHSLEEPKEKEKSVLRDSSVSDSEENSVIKDSDLSMGDTDNQVSSLESSLQNLSEFTQPLTAKATDRESSLPCEKNWSECSDDTQRNLGNSETALLTKKTLYDSIMDIESGVEALEDNIDGFSDIPEANGNSPDQGEISSNKYPLLTSNKQQSQRILEKKAEPSLRTQFLTFSVYFLTFLVFINWYLFRDSNLWNGFLLGLWVCFMASKLHQYLMEVLFGEEPAREIQLRRSSSVPIYTIPSVKEHRPLKKYEGWVNHYKYPEYDPCTYNLSKTVSAFMKLEGCNLRISYTKVKIPKRQLWDEKIEKVPFYQHRLYDLTGARIILLPKGLVKRRLWSKKYPICVILKENHQIHVLEKENVSGEGKKGTELDKKKEPHEIEAETNTSPEKKKKFMWRRRDKSPATPDLEPGKEGLRHRFVSRKKHKDKKSDATTSGAETPEPPPTEKDPAQKTEELPMLDAEQDPPKCKDKDKPEADIEEDIDEKELSRFKDFLEDPELEGAVDGTSEGEWSMHTQEQRQHHLFIFTRTGRDKHEWYRRISIAISDANPKSSSETSTSDDKSLSESQQIKEESKESIDTAVYKVTDKDTVAFAKQSTTSQGKTEPLLPEGPIPSSPPAPVTPSPDSYEKAFWPYLQKIIECHAVSSLTKSEVGVMCDIKPTSSRKHSKIKKIMKRAKPENAKCDCRVLPAEVTWLNTLIARAVFDIARNPAVIASLQDRIQRKLATLKLPSFMSPLVVTELSVLGASPLIERVYPVAWDDRGLWLDADLRYDGGAYITVLTQINLMKLKKNATIEEQILEGQFLEENILIDGQEILTENVTKRTKRAVYDSDVEDSAESSDEEEEAPHTTVDTVILPSSDAVPSDVSPTAGSSKKKFLRMVDKIATNKYFQQVTDYKYVKRAMEGLSNTDIKLQLEIQGLEGRLTFNLPPPPHDRVWLGFRTNPQLVLKARPAVGQRTLRFAHITNWIEQKLTKEFEKVLVLPNMEDFVISMLAPTPIQFE